MLSPLDAVLTGPGLHCPDDGSRLERSGHRLACPGCARVFPVYDEDLVELLPSSPTRLDDSVAKTYRQGYLTEFARPLTITDTGTAWGAPEGTSPSWVKRRQRQAEFCLSLLPCGGDGRARLLCDLSAAAGYYTIAHAQRFDFVLHCDLGVESLNYARRRAQSMSATNVLFLRIDYFRPPFRRSVENLVCCDTLIRGEAHEAALLKAIALSTAPGGVAVIDFHNWWHNPLRRSGLLPQNFGDNRSLSRRECDSLLHRARISRFDCQPFRQEFDAPGRLARIVSKVVPPSRLVYRLHPDA